MFVRKNVCKDKIKATSNFCIYCGTYLQEWEKEVDHFLPIAFMGNSANYKANMYVSCRECNSIKQDRTFCDIEEARKYILEIKTAKGVAIKFPSRQGCYHRDFGLANCRVCGIQFTKKAENHQKCTSNCHCKKEKKICKHCKKEFIGALTRVYCSRECRLIYAKINP